MKTVIPQGYRSLLSIYDTQKAISLLKRLFEDRSFHPERMLRELVALFHPELLPGYEMKYYERMR